MDTDEDVGRPPVSRAVGDQCAFSGERLDRLELLLDVFLRDGAAPAAAGCNQKHDRYQERACKHLTRQYPLERIPTRPPLDLVSLRP